MQGDRGRVPLGRWRADHLGRVRGRIQLAAGTTETEAVGAARAAVDGLPPAGSTARVVFVPGRVVNFVTA
jgi:hypothetical protein